MSGLVDVFTRPQNSRLNSQTGLKDYDKYVITLIRKFLLNELNEEHSICYSTGSPEPDDDKISPAPEPSAPP
jgi:hypothetical protein